MLAHSLAKHSELWASGENDLLFFLFENGLMERAFDRAIEVPGQRWLRLEEVSREEFLAHLGMGINALITSRSGGHRWIDHTPLNTRIVDTVAEVFPGASFIHILRDGRSVVRSMLSFADAAPNPAVRRFLKRNVEWATDMRGACAAWRDHVEAAMAFCDEHPDRAAVVRYEDLVAAPQAAFREIHRFLGIADEEGPAGFLASKRINSSFVERRRLSANELWEAWTTDERRRFAEIAGATMLKCGYWTPDEFGSQSHGREHSDRYQGLTARVRRAVVEAVPADGTVLIVSRGDDELLRVDGRRMWHFPRDDDGGYAGHHPADSETAIAHLEQLRAKGATHLVLPRTAFWWLEHYEGLSQHLDAAYRRIRSDEHVIVYDLAGARPANAPARSRSGVRDVEKPAR